MFDDVYSVSVDRVYEALGRYGKGDTVGWEVIEAAMGQSRDAKGGRQIVKRVVRRLLRDREIVAYPRTNVGIRLLTDSQAAVEVPELRQKKARRQINRGMRETDAINLGELPKHQAAALAISRRHMREERRALSRAKKEVETLLKPAARNPCRPSN